RTTPGSPGGETCTFHRSAIRRRHSSLASIASTSPGTATSLFKMPPINAPPILPAPITTIFNPIVLPSFPAEDFPVEKQRFIGVQHGVIPAMAAGIEVSFMRVAGFGQHFIEFLCADLKPVVVFRPAIKINLETVQLLRVFCKRHWVVRFPIVQI